MHSSFLMGYRGPCTNTKAFSAPPATKRFQCYSFCAFHVRMVSGTVQWPMCPRPD